MPQLLDLTPKKPGSSPTKAELIEELCSRTIDRPHFENPQEWTLWDAERLEQVAKAVRVEVAQEQEKAKTQRTMRQSS